MTGSEASEPTRLSTDDEDFEAAWAIADTVPGWLKKDQARLLYDEARRLAPGSRLLEIGSHQGRSTVVLGKAVAHAGGTLTCVDPFVEGRLFGGEPTRRKFERNIETAGVAEHVQLLAEYSTDLRPRWTEPLDFLYIDGKHDMWTAGDDLRWSQHLSSGSAVLVHDSFSSIGVTLALLRHVLGSRTLRYEGRSDSMALFRVGRPDLADRLRLCRELPWWIRNVGIKVLLRLRLRAVARAVGHDSPYDPY